jgi:hypothetical protein
LKNENTKQRKILLCQVSGTYLIPLAQSSSPPHTTDTRQFPTSYHWHKTVPYLIPLIQDRSLPHTTSTRQFPTSYHWYKTVPYLILLAQDSSLPHHWHKTVPYLIPPAQDTSLPHTTDIWQYPFLQSWLTSKVATHFPPIQLLPE